MFVKRAVVEIVGVINDPELSDEATQEQLNKAAEIVVDEEKVNLIKDVEVKN